MASKLPPVKNSAFTFSTMLFAQDDNQIKITPTLVAGDVKISKDSGAIANPGTLPVEDPASSGIIKIVLTDTEMNADEVVVYFKDAADDEWHSQAIVLHTVANGQQFDDLSTFDEASDTVDVGKISGDSDAADNLELQYDTTGLIGDTFPATQAAVGNLTSGTAAINTTAESFTKIAGGAETNTYLATTQEDGNYHIVEDDAGATDFYYQFNVGGNGVPVSITWHGYAQSQGDSYTVWAYNYNTLSYEQIGTISAANGTTAATNTYGLTNAHVGTGVNLGKVRFRFLSADGTALSTDRLLCSYAVVAQSVGYADGAIWVNTNASNTNTETYIDGTADNPVSTWAAALTISANLGITRFHIINGSTITLTGNSDNYTFKGFEWTLATGGQSLAGAYVEGAIVTGVAIGAGARYFYCKMAQGASFTTEALGLKDCGIAGDIIASAAGTYIIDACFSAVAGTATPNFDFGAVIGDVNLNMRHYSGGIEIENMGVAGTDKMSLEGFGQLVINANCSAGVVAIRGAFTITDNAGAALTLSDDARIDIDQINAEMVDVLNIDIYAESVAPPAASDTLAAKIVWLATLARNKIMQDAVTQTLRNDADDADIAISVLDDSAGTFVRGEFT